MKFLVVVRMCERELSIGQPSTVTFNAISEAMRRAARPSSEGWGEWVGPAPRVTRGRFEGCLFSTTAAWLYDVPEATTAEQRYTVERDLRERLMTHLRIAQSADGFWQVTMINYDPALNGSETWWQSGQASRTRTQDSPDSGPTENPTGPDDARPAQVTLADRARSGLDSLSPYTPLIVLGVAGLITIAVLVWLGPRLLAGRALANARQAPDPWDRRDWTRPR